MDLLAFLTTSYLQQEDLTTGLNDHDWRLHALDSMISNDPTDSNVRPEERVLLSYLQLSVEELDSLPIAIHEWFLERLSMSQVRGEIEDLASRIARVYFLAGAGLYRYLCITALLTLDEARETDRSPTGQVSRFILDPHNFEGRDKAEMIEELAIVLLDAGHLSVNHGPADRALRNLWLETVEFAEAHARIERHVIAMAEDTEGTRREQLRGIVGR